MIYEKLKNVRGEVFVNGDRCTFGIVYISGDYVRIRIFKDGKAYAVYTLPANTKLNVIVYIDKVQFKFIKKARMI